jgi:hypothetical protein
MPTPSASISADSGDTPRTDAASRADENGHSPRQQADALPPAQSNRRVKSPTKLTKLKPHFATPPRASRRASSKSDCEQNGDADNEEAQAPIHSGNTLESYVLPKSLRMNRWDVNFLTSGIEVIKVSKARSFAMMCIWPII